jgi:hypothetical protein
LVTTRRKTRRRRSNGNAADGTPSTSGGVDADASPSSSGVHTSPSSSEESFDADDSGTPSPFTSDESNDNSPATDTLAAPQTLSPALIHAESPPSTHGGTSTTTDDVSPVPTRRIVFTDSESRSPGQATNTGTPPSVTAARKRKAPDELTCLPADEARMPSPDVRRTSPGSNSASPRDRDFVLGTSPPLRATSAATSPHAVLLSPQHLSPPSTLPQHTAHSSPPRHAPFLYTSSGEIPPSAQRSPELGPVMTSLPTDGSLTSGRPGSPPRELTAFDLASADAEANDRGMARASPPHLHLHTNGTSGGHSSPSRSLLPPTNVTAPARRANSAPFTAMAALVDARAPGSSSPLAGVSLNGTTTASPTNHTAASPPAHAADPHPAKRRRTFDAAATM